MQDIEQREKKRMMGRGKIALIVAVSFLMGLFLIFAKNNLGSDEQKANQAIIRQSPLVWRVDGSGNSLLPAIAQNQTYELTTSVETKGKIKTITANWEFTGQAQLEVSANDGTDYFPVVCGVPIDFTQDKQLIDHTGNKLKWKATLGPDSKLTKIKIAYTDFGGLAGTFGEPQLSGFKFRKTLSIKTPTSSKGAVPQELFNYQLKVKIGESSGANSYYVHCNGNIQADFKDIRFCAGDGETLLPYYIEDITGKAPNRTATCYVKIPQLPKNGLLIYLYYGKLNAEDSSNGNATFDFFDVFSRPNGIPQDAGKAKTLDATKWKTDTDKITSVSYQLKDGIMEYRALAASGSKVGAIVRSGASEDLSWSVSSSDLTGQIVVL